MEIDEQRVNTSAHFLGTEEEIFRLFIIILADTLAVVAITAVHRESISSVVRLGVTDEARTLDR